MDIATPEAWYRVEPGSDGVTHIYEPYIKAFYRCNVWHVRGRDRDLLVDSGMGVVSLSAQVHEVTERPLLAVALAGLPLLHIAGTAASFAFP